MHSFPLVSEEKAGQYYEGIPSCPRLILTTWDAEETNRGPPKRKLKHLWPVFDSRFSNWLSISDKIIAILDARRVLWSCIDVVRFKIGHDLSPIIIWLAIKPSTLTYEDAYIAAVECLSLLKQFDLTDIQIEFRESTYVQLNDPLPLLASARSSLDPTHKVRHPLTSLLHLPIATEKNTNKGGTGGLYLSDGSSGKTFLLTARHVLFSDTETFDYDLASNEAQPRRKVIILGTKDLKKLREDIKMLIKRQSKGVDNAKEEVKWWQMKTLESNKGRQKAAAIQLEKAQSDLSTMRDALGSLREFKVHIKKKWNNPERRIIGHVVYSPPLAFGVGEEGFTQDFAVIELDSKRIDKSTFQGNVIDMMAYGVAFDEFNKQMFPSRDSADFASLAQDRFLRIQNETISVDELRQPTTCDENGDPCLYVLKSGKATGLTYGRANGVFSRTREYAGAEHTSVEWCILPRKTWAESGCFSACGDSGSIVVDGLGRIGGLLIGGNGDESNPDVSYATPFAWLLPRIQRSGFPNVRPQPGRGNRDV